MKKELLEYLIRECVNEVLEAFPDAADPETVGAPAPPEAGQGTADQPEIPQAGPNPLAQPKGLFYVNPARARDEQYKGDQIKNLAGKEIAQVERELYRIASRSGGPRLKVAAQTLRDIPKVLAGQAPALYLYIGAKGPEHANDPQVNPTPEEGEDIKLFPAPTLQAAKKLSVPSGVSAEHPQTAITPKDTTYARAYDPQGPEAAAKTTAPDIDESNVLSSMIRECLNDMRKGR